MPAPCSWSATTGASSTTSSPARSRGKATSAGLWREYEGGYEDWKTQRERARGLREPRRRAAPPTRRGAATGARSAAAATPPTRPPPKPRKLSYKEQRELDALPARIDALEAEQKELGELLADARVLCEGAGPRAAAQARYAQIDAELTARARALGGARQPVRAGHGAGVVRMNFQQLRAVRETIRRDFNLTEVAKVLHTSQPAISRQIRELEEGARRRPRPPDGSDRGGSFQRTASFACTAFTMRWNSSRLTSEITQWFMPPCGPVRRLVTALDREARRAVVQPGRARRTR